MTTTPFRVRFAPAPTGMMHLGNIRTALMNYLIAQQKQGTFVLRIEDTDGERNFDPEATKIIEDLTWLGLIHDEGPQKGGAFGPYFQSQRTELYNQKLQELISKQQVYRCFCSSEELEKRRLRQIALKQPPRYDRTCYKLSQEESGTRAASEPFIWRMYIDQTKTVTINDLSHGPVTFDLKNFSDFPLTRQDGSITFLFANFVDDVMMKMTCVIRGEDHLSNTACQAALYAAFDVALPTFWHMPILCNIDGKKLSKRDFGFSLRDLKHAGFLPEAILNYLAIIGGSFTQEIMSVQELIKTFNFEGLSSTGQIKYDVEKLRWTNHKWLCLLPKEKVAALARPYVESVYEESKKLSETNFANLIGQVQKEMVTLEDSIRVLAFYFTNPLYQQDIARTLVSTDKLQKAKEILASAVSFTTIDQLLTLLKTESAAAGIAPKELYSLVRYALMGLPSGPGIKDLVEILGVTVCQKRFNDLAQLL